MIAERAAHARQCGVRIGLVMAGLIVFTGAVRHARLPEQSFIPFLLVALAYLAVAAILWTRPRASLLTSSLLTLAANLALLPLLWHAVSIVVASGRPWTPFQGAKVAALVIALFAPEVPWLQVTSVVAIIGESVVQYASFSAEIRARLAMDEPISTFVYAGLALMLFFYRYRRYEVARQAARVRAEAASLQRLAQSFLAVRDLTNTPLQTLQLSVETIGRHHPELAAEVARMKRSLARLAELERLLASHEAEIDWEHIGASFDPVRVLSGDLPVPAERAEPSGGLTPFEASRRTSTTSARDDFPSIGGTRPPSR